MCDVPAGLGDLHNALASVPAAAALPGVLTALNERMKLSRHVLIEMPFSSGAQKPATVVVIAALGLAIEGVGVEKVLTVLPLRPQGTPDITGVADSRAWLIPLLQEHGKACPGRLAYFHQHIVELAKHCDQVARSGKLTGNEAKTQSLRVAQVCSGLQVLITGAESRRIPAELQALSSTSTKFLPALFGLADRGTDTALPEDKCIIGKAVYNRYTCIRQWLRACRDSFELLLVLSQYCTVSTGNYCFQVRDHNSRRVAHWHACCTTTTLVLAVCGAAAAFARVAPTPFLSQLFKRLLQKLLEATAALQTATAASAASKKADKTAAVTLRDSADMDLDDDTTTTTATANTADATRLPLAYLALAAALAPSLRVSASSAVVRSVAATTVAHIAYSSLCGDQCWWLLTAVAASTAPCTLQYTALHLDRVGH
eukprot:13636-Heterococcus_DN1.PRE.3